MRNKPRIQFKGFTEDWEQRKLGDLAEIVRGASPRPISDPKWFDNDSDVGWLRIADVTAQDGRIRYLEQKISELGQEKTRVIKTPHLLLSIAATVGKPVINYVPTGVHDGFLIFLNPKFNILYTFWWLEMFREKWNKYGQPGSQVNLNSDLVKNQDINIPNEKEQEKISSFLESLHKIITLHQRKLEKLKLAKKALLQKLFPKNGSQFPEIRFKGFTDAWEQCRLGDITRTNSFKRYLSNAFEVGEYEVIQQGEAPIAGYANGRPFFDYKNITLFGDHTLSLFKPKKPFFIASDGVKILSPLLKIDGWFYYYLLEQYKPKSEGYKRHFTILKNCEAYLSNNQDEQIKIGNIFMLLDKLITLHQSKLDRLQEVKKGLLQKMFV